MANGQMYGTKKSKDKWSGTATAMRMTKKDNPEDAYSERENPNQAAAIQSHAQS